MGERSYRYSLRRGDQIIATGHFLSERPIDAGEELAIGSRRGLVVAVEPSYGSTEEQLTIELVVPDESDDGPADDIARRAYELSLEAGAGSDEDNWLRAERELDDES